MRLPVVVEHSAVIGRGQHHHLLELGGSQLRERHLCMFDMGLAVGVHELEGKMESLGSEAEVGVGAGADSGGRRLMLAAIVAVIGSCAGQVLGTGIRRFVVAEADTMAASLVVGERWRPGIGQCWSVPAR